MLSWCCVYSAILMVASGAINSPYCTPTNISCWPTQLEINTLKQSISGRLLLPTSPEYELYVIPQNLLVTVRPYFIMLPDINIDIRKDMNKSIEFVNRHNLELSILSTGHSYFGRSFGEYTDSFQINFSKHKKFRINEDYTRLTAESGVTFGDVYKALDMLPQKRLFPGGDCHSVGVVGYSLGGGQSPLSSYLGLGIDSVISYKLIVANGSYVISMNNGTGLIMDNEIIWNENNDLFWALRGSGGNSFGIILNVTFMLHSYDDVNGITNLKIKYPFYLDNGTVIGDIILSNYVNSLPSFTNKVNTYVSIFYHASNNFSINSINVVFDLLYIGNITMAQNELNVLSNFKPEWQEGDGAEYIQYASFWEWESANNQRGVSRAYYYSSLFTQYNLTQNNVYIDTVVHYIDEFVSMQMNKKIDPKVTFFYISVVMNGNVSNIKDNETSITPAFRTAALYTFSTMLWFNNNNDDIIIQYMDKYSIQFSSTSSNGAYFNEDRPDNENYIHDYWTQQHFHKLIEIKNIWDPAQLFHCHHCINSSVQQM